LPSTKYGLLAFRSRCSKLVTVMVWSSEPAAFVCALATPRSRQQSVMRMTGIGQSGVNRCMNTDCLFGITMPLITQAYWHGRASDSQAECASGECRASPTHRGKPTAMIGACPVLRATSASDSVGSCASSAWSVVGRRRMLPYIWGWIGVSYQTWSAGEESPA
jgi:hypothetical protein